MTSVSSLTRTKRRYAWLFLGPMLVVLAMVAGWPLLRTIVFGFTDANLSDLGTFEFIGLENFYAVYDGESFGVLVDPEWWQAVWNTLRFAVISVSLETIFGMIVALVLNVNFKGRGLVRAAVLVPWAIPTIVSARMWNWMLHDQFGILNEILMTLGILSQPVAWTADPDLAMAAVVMVDVWKTTPFMALLLLAALQMLPTEAVIFRALDALRIFDLIYVLTPNSVDTMSMSIYARQQLVDFQEVGYGSAASTLLFLIIALCIIAYILIGRVKLAGET
jgi:trehalose/maltose transport system permease protein